MCMRYADRFVFSMHLWKQTTRYVSQINTLRDFFNNYICSQWRLKYLCNLYCLLNLISENKNDAVNLINNNWGLIEHGIRNTCHLVCFYVRHILKKRNIVFDMKSKILLSYFINVTKHSLKVFRGGFDKKYIFYLDESTYKFSWP